MFADDQLEFGYELDHKASVGAERLAQGPAPTFQLKLALTQKAADEPLESLSDRRVRNIALMLVELARGEKTAGRTSALCNSLTTEDLPIPEYPRDQHQLGRAGVATRS